MCNGGFHDSVHLSAGKHYTRRPGQWAVVVGQPSMGAMEDRSTRSISPGSMIYDDTDLLRALYMIGFISCAAKDRFTENVPI